MPADKAAVIAQLQKELLPLQGLRHPSTHTTPDMGWGPVQKAFPNGTFPTGAIHEFLHTGMTTAAATGGFISGILGYLMQQGAACLWISRSPVIFPPGLQRFGVSPHQVVFIVLQREQDILWAMEEALQCEGLAAVVAEVSHMSFTASRRLQLAVEQSRVTGFVIHPQQTQIPTTTCVARWRISPVPGATTGDMPGVGFPRWKVDLLKIRNGRPGQWQLEWRDGRFHTVDPRRTHHLSVISSTRQTG